MRQPEQNAGSKAREIKSRHDFMVILVAASFLLAGPGLAQTAGDATAMLPEIDIRGRGWSQISNPGEMAEFALGLLELIVLTALIAFHPVRLATPGAQANGELPKTLFSYALVGMIVGFLVMHHGYLIGFVIFGLGGLLRFRTDAEEPGDTRRMIVVTLIGLCVGLDLPVMAAITAASSWLIIYFLSVRRHLVLHIMFKEKKDVRASMQDLETELQKRGFGLISMHKKGFKPIAECVISNTDKNTRESLLMAMGSLQVSKDCAISDWYIE